MLNSMSVGLKYASFSGKDLHTVSRVLDSKAGFTSEVWIQPMQWGRARPIHV
jgi:hypothetical protein